MATEVLRSVNMGSDPLIASSIDRLITHSRSAGMFFDFDGVLSSIQEDPESAQPLPRVKDILRSFVGHVSTVTVLSSRPASFLRERFADVDGLTILGLYGLERIEPTGNIEVAEDVEIWSDKMLAVLEAAKDRFKAAESPVRVEDKRLAIGIHYRAAPHLKSEVEAWAQLARSTWGVRIQPGRFAVELRPELPVDKGSTLSQRAESLSTAWYCGDDLGDVPAMSYVQDRRRGDASFSGLCIGVGNDAIVHAVFQAADVFVESPEVLLDLLSLTLKAVVN